jgi:hypothetical protein
VIEICANPSIARFKFFLRVICTRSIASVLLLDLLHVDLCF